jgi:uncharacterized membrane protein SpoIIM required for sporulation
MNEARFIEKYEATWERFEEVLAEVERPSGSKPIDAFPTLFRTLCNHLTLARSRGYSAALVERLNPLVERGHAVLYANRSGRWDTILDYIGGGYARDVRRNWRTLTVAMVVFFGSYFGVLTWLMIEPEWAVHVLGPGMAANMEQMYESAEEMRKARQADSDVLMFGYYINNNVGIGLRTFGSGVVFGLGSLFTLLFNGVVLGAASAHVTNVGYGANFWSFVITHGSFELTAIGLAGQAGLKIGFAPIWPGRRRRLQALREEARDSFGLVGGFTVMLVIAAFIEAFWSSSTVPAQGKYIVGTACWLFVIGYFVFAGRGGGRE